MGFYEETGILILGTRLKRLSERFLSEVGKIYERLGIDFEAAWFPAFFLIHHKGPLSITEIAENLNVSQPAASQLISLLHKKGYIQLIVDPHDKRRKIASFSHQGLILLDDLIPIWETLEKKMVDMFDEEDVHIVESFNQLENKLNRISFGDSVLNSLKLEKEGAENE